MSEQVQERTYTQSEYKELQAENATLKEALRVVSNKLNIASNTVNRMQSSAESIKAQMINVWGEWFSTNYLDEVSDNLFIPMTYKEAICIKDTSKRLVSDLNDTRNVIIGILDSKKDASDSESEDSA
jgi:hypothetical protein